MGNVAPHPKAQVARIRAALKNAADVQPIMDVRHLVKGWLSEGALSVLFGPSNTGKTFIALSLAAHVASGRPWWGRRVKQAPVLYVALEGGIGFTNRVAAIVQHLPELGRTRGLTFLNAPLDLYEEAGFQDFCDALPDENWGLIIIDTLARAMCGADENAARDMGHFIGNLDRLREITGAHVMVVHHSGKDAAAGARGSSALRAAVDSELALSTDGVLSASKQRDMAAAPPLFFDLEKISFGRNADGDEVSSAIAVATKEPARQAKRLSGKAEVAMQALDDAIREHGETKRGEDFPANRPCVHISHWREICERKGLTDKGTTPSAQRKAFARAKDKLMETDHIRIQDEYVWRVHPDG